MNKKNNLCSSVILSSKKKNSCSPVLLSKKTSIASKNLSLVSRFCAAKARPLCLEKNMFLCLSV